MVILIDNSPHPHVDLLTEHGLSIYLEIDNCKYLIDVGASEKFANNADRLGIDIAEIDHLILSHAHADHTGGLAEFINMNDKAGIYMSSHITGDSYYSTRRETKRDISPDYSIIKSFQKRFVRICDDVLLSPSVTVLSNIPIMFDTPKANRTLFVNDMQDDFKHEIALCIETPGGYVVISSCSHMGILNTLSACKKQDIVAYIGGTHLVDSDDYNEYETNEQLESLVQSLECLYPGINLVTGHCTGSEAQKSFATMMGTRLTPFYSGFTMTI